MVEDRRRIPDATNPQDSELETIRGEISRLLPLKSQSGPILLLVDRIIKMAKEIRPDPNSIEAGIKEYLRAVLGVQPFMITGPEEMEILRIVKEIAQPNPNA